jgi:hypothetical protein
MIKTTWNSIKNIKSATNNNIYYSIENEYYSNDPNIPDKNRYYIIIQDVVDRFYCFITIENPVNTNQEDFENNYKPNAIET